MVGQRDFFLEIRTENAELNFFNQTAKRNELKKRNDFRGLKHQRYGIFGWIRFANFWQSIKPQISIIIYDELG